jgi:hypothetical protein
LDASRAPYLLKKLLRGGNDADAVNQKRLREIA